MKVKELMIGDWMYNCIADIRFQIYPQFFSQWYNRTEQFMSTIQPIPFTPEILEKNGFIHYTDFYMWKEESSEPVHLDNYNEDGWRLRINCDNIPCECKYVHQLQHALRLCGIKKEITL